MLDGISELSIIPTILIQKLVNVKNGKAQLPQGFKKLVSAVKCEPWVFTPEEDCSEDILQDIYYYKVREIKDQTWNVCNPCEVEEKETCVVEKVYFHNGLKGSFRYRNLEPLKLNLTTHVKRTVCDKDCPNLNVKRAKNEISINQNTLYANFQEGSIVLTYRGLEEDDEGFIIIPETIENNIFKFLKAYVQRGIIRKLFYNSDNTTNEQFLYQMFDRDVQEYRVKAIGEFKMGAVMRELRSGQYSKALAKEKLSFINLSPKHPLINYLIL